MALINTIPFGLQLCEVLGLDPDRIRNINISVGADAAVIVTIERHLWQNEAAQLLKILEEYELTKIN